MNSAVITSNSTTSTIAPDSVDEDVRWSAVSAGLWVGRVKDACVGVIEERWREGFIVRDGCARQLGHFKTLAEAKGYFG